MEMDMKINQELEEYREHRVSLYRTSLSISTDVGKGHQGWDIGDSTTLPRPPFQRPILITVVDNAFLES